MAFPIAPDPAGKRVKPKPRHDFVGENGWRLIVGGSSAILVALLVLPLIGLIFTLAPAQAWQALGDPLVWPAVRLSFTTTAIALAIVVMTGTPFSWLIARKSTAFVRALEMLTALPAVIPPAVAGLALLLAFGRRGAIVQWTGLNLDFLAFTPAAVVIAQIFVASPFFIQAATAAFRRLDQEVLVVASTLGATPMRVFFRIALPLAWPGLAAGAAMAWARALGEFGATLMFAGSLPHQTQTMPLAIYAAFEIDIRLAQALAVGLVAVAAIVLWWVRRLTARMEKSSPTLAGWSTRSGGV